MITIRVSHTTILVTADVGNTLHAQPIAIKMIHGIRSDDIIFFQQITEKNKCFIHMPISFLYMSIFSKHVFIFMDIFLFNHFY